VDRTCLKRIPFPISGGLAESRMVKPRTKGFIGLLLFLTVSAEDTVRSFQQRQGFLPSLDLARMDFVPGGQFANYLLLSNASNATPALNDRLYFVRYFDTSHFSCLAL
jgi:hypothetical protein